MDYCVKNLELEFTSMLAYLQACKIPKNRRASMLFSVADVMFLRTVVPMVATLSELRSLLAEAQMSELAAVAEKKGRNGIWKTHFAGKRDESFQLWY